VMQDDAVGLVFALPWAELREAAWVERAVR
jgi:hypothetical protein